MGWEPAEATSLGTRKPGEPWESLWPAALLTLIHCPPHTGHLHTSPQPCLLLQAPRDTRTWEPYAQAGTFLQPLG